MNIKRLVPFTFVLFIFIAFGIVSSQAKTNDAELTPMEQLGKHLFFDKISSPDSMSCADCHAPNVGFTGPVGGINKHGAVYRGAVPQRFGNRKPPSAAYATLSPIFHYDAGEDLFVGGNFWDGRATGEVLGNPAADQALGPFLNPVEQNNTSKMAVLEQVAFSKYADLWENVWGEPVSYGTQAEIEKNYDRIGLAIAAYEDSSEVNQFSSKYDYYLQGEVELTEQEAWGLELFEGKGLCAECHPSQVGAGGEPPLFTDFTFDNLGVPKNLDNPFYSMDTVYLDDGSPINPEGSAWIDWGLGGFLANHSDPFYQSKAAENLGKHKVPTLRNVDKSPGNNFPKAFMHNGVFKSLKELVHFYNTRDVEAWPPAEVLQNINTDELGNLGLTDEEENAIVAFMKTLSDGYKKK
jgi:cytochrome c peroxidase